MPQTGMVWGRPSGQTLATQKFREVRSFSSAQDQGSSPLPSSAGRIP
jgi:hypothetical protein